jgi:hypothetical protein
MISCATYVISESGTEETLVSCEFYGPNIFEDYIWIYVVPP